MAFGYMKTRLRELNWVAVVVRNLQKGITNEFIKMKMLPLDANIEILYVTPVTKVRNQLCALVVF